MDEMKKSFTNILLSECFGRMAQHGIYLECGTLVLSSNEPDCEKTADLSLVFVGDADE